MMGERPIHPIGVVAARTGLSADVIRVWERRYGVVDPARDDADRRLYSDADIERLRLLARATSAGRGIGQVAFLGMAELRELVQADDEARWDVARGGAAPGGANGAVEESPERVVERALDRVRAMDSIGLEADLRRSAALLGLSEFLEGVVAPLFRRIGDEWHADRLSVAQEHLASEVAGSVVTRIAASLAGSRGAPLVMVGTPAGEQHQIGALLASTAAGAEGWRVAYLGSSIPAEDIASAARAAGARCVALSVVSLSASEAVSQVRAVREALPPHVGLVVGGAGAGAVGERGDLGDVEWLRDLGALRTYLRNRANGSRA